MRAVCCAGLVLLMICGGCAAKDESPAADGGPVARPPADLRADAPPESSGDVPPAVEPLFADELEAILQNLLTTYWDESGDWRGDMQGDATAFAPGLLFALGQERDDPALIAKATQTVDYATSLISVDMTMEAVIGFPALVDGYRYTGDESYKTLLRLGVLAGTDVIARSPEMLLPYVGDLATVYGTAAHLCLLTHQVLAEQIFLDKALALIDRANDECWDEQAGMYRWDEVIDWPQATMLMALAKAYAATGDVALLERARRTLDSIDACCLDERRGGYYGHVGEHGKGLSGNNNMVWALLDLFEATGEPPFLDRAEAILRWTLSPDVYSAQDHLIYHHWESDQGTTPGRADYFCTGCIFETLFNIYRFNRLRQGAS